MEEAIEEILEDVPKGSIAPLMILMIVTGFQLLSGWLEFLRKRGARTDTEMQLRAEIKQLLKEASSLSQPSTFAQAARLRRIAASKERELENYKESLRKEMKSDLYGKLMLGTKALIYLTLICCYWGDPVAIISQQLVSPFGKLLSWKAGGTLNGNVKVGVIPWLILSTRVSKFICQLFKF